MHERLAVDVASTLGTLLLCAQLLAKGSHALDAPDSAMLAHSHDARACSVIRDARNLNITRDKVLLWQATDLLIECASVRLRLNEAELRTGVFFFNFL